MGQTHVEDYVTGLIKVVLIKANRGQLWKGKQNKYYELKKWKSNVVQLFIIMKLQNHLVIVKNGKF
jgi:hypothetical protein